MNKSEITSLLESKVHNDHYLARYIKYIELCANKNIDLNTTITNSRVTESRIKGPSIMNLKDKINA